MIYELWKETTMIVNNDTNINYKNNQRSPQLAEQRKYLDI